MIRYPLLAQSIWIEGSGSDRGIEPHPPIYGSDWIYLLELLFAWQGKTYKYYTSTYLFSSVGQIGALRETFKSKNGCRESWPTPSKGMIPIQIKRPSSCIQIKDLLLFHQAYLETVV